ncbi:MAG: DNA methyltransferase [Microcystis aeruginosa Ma_QC_Ch_20071001_S25]|uniref:site-specific DNA-methyltransferase (adenine-specific) n=1 Tax=Microcystis aeruginosa Ma_QC_Ch_20071001_S25D TaxID=2486250 RepID=A0A552FKW3_MICAE|nr:MAG: DNA methyltransferase [Microcystis aeruginosa Ma_QC_Ch_20071001_S25D]TRU54185.1 MAG: DNA methyltransferase [Microcystis aeruginosa Ma_QC_Ch_20071001_S25]TRU66909.1 MAG: DNA methyltransferase [Microcystis aeruginosa Ma_QC_Ch_20071001_M135]
MSRLLISQYQTEVEKIVQYGGSRKETSIRVAFQNLLNDYCKARDFLLIPELDYRTKSGKVVYPDGTVKDALRLDWGYWESKDQYDNLDEEIEKKLAKGYPNDNILFEDSQTAVLIQGGEERLRVSMRDDEALDGIINAFINYVRPEVEDFREAIDSFKEDLPTILEALRGLIALQSETNRNFVTMRDNFLEICRKSINPEISLEDVREMIIQHILTEDIFINIFNESQFHRENNIARELQGVIETFFTGNTKRNTLGTIERYYAVIRRTAANIYNHHEKQKFLKAIYENFYKAYNPKAADRLGIVYTPNEIVRFMIESVDYLVHKHFGKLLADSGVEILDPATGTGTFVTELIEYLPKDKLRYKYKYEMHCNEVAILPYYIANLNIEFTYKQKMGEYEEFEHICFVDTLDHAAFHLKQMDLFAMSVENTQRIQNQNDRNISVIIGNPPYNANQQNENDNNKNRKYPAIDKRIKDTYVKESTAQKTKVYDMYSRFFRWGTDRLGDNGIISFITNSSFINAKGFDGFRKSVVNEFDYIYTIDLGGDIREGDTTGNVFNIITGVAITFMIKIKSKNKLPCQIMYCNTENFNSAQEKLDSLAKTKFDYFTFEHIKPDHQNNWVNLTDNDFDNLISIADKKNKSIFEVFSNGVATNRDEWVYDIDLENLENKSIFFIDEYNHEVKRWIQYKKNNKYQDIKKEDNPIVDKFIAERNLIKWSSRIKRDKLRKEKTDIFNREDLRESHYRPFVKRYIYFSYIPIDIKGSQHLFFSKKSSSNHVICFANNEQTDILVLAINTLCDLNFCARGSSCFALYTYDENGNRVDNITDWGLQQFQNHYKDKNLTKLDIFHYTYGVLHNPEYRTKYELNLKRKFPRLPFYDNFYQWVEWGSKLMELHINYETVEPYPLTRIDTNNNLKPKTKLKADREKNSINLDDITFLQDIPKIAWEYKLGNRSALEWILDQYKEKKPKDQTIAERFNTYRFADYKETVIDLLQRVCTVSVETMKIIEAMKH